MYPFGAVFVPPSSLAVCRDDEGPASTTGRLASSIDGVAESLPGTRAGRGKFESAPTAASFPSALGPRAPEPPEHPMNKVQTDAISFIGSFLFPSTGLEVDARPEG